MLSVVADRFQWGVVRPRSASVESVATDLHRIGATVLGSDWFSTLLA